MTPLVPFWAKGDLPKCSTANCRAEAAAPFPRTVAKKPTFRGAWKRGRRCLVPFSYCFDFWNQRTKPKQPWRIYPAEVPMFVMAGLWDSSPAPENDVIESCTIVTTEPNSQLKRIGHHLAPALLPPDA